MHTNDPFMDFLNMRVLSAEGAEASVCATVAPHHINMHGTAHGGFLFSLSDAAFALASNSGPGRQVGLHADMQYFRAARLGDTVTAHATELHLGRKTGAFRMELRVDGQLIAMGSGLVYRVDSGREGGGREGGGQEDGGRMDGGREEAAPLAPATPAAPQES